MHVILVANEDRNRMWKMRQMWTKWLKRMWDWHLLNYFLSNTEFLSISIPFSFGKEMLIRAINPLFQCELASTNKQSISAAGNTGMAVNRISAGPVPRNVCHLRQRYFHYDFFLQKVLEEICICINHSCTSFCSPLLYT